MDNLEKDLEEAYAKLGIGKEQQDSLNTRLAMVKERDYETWEHSVRVGLKGVEVAEFIHLDPKAMLYAGNLHDVGKVLTDPKSLKKKQGFDEKDMKELLRHPNDGYKMLRGINDYSAAIIVRHHQYVGAGYPKQLPQGEIDFSKGSKAMIAYYSRLLGLVDFYDAVTHRENDKFSEDGKPRLPTPEQAKEILLKANPDQVILINELYEAEIF